MVANFFIAPIRFVVAVFVCTGIFIFSILDGVRQLPINAIDYAREQSTITFRNLKVDFPRFRKDFSRSSVYEDLSLKKSLGIE